MSLILSQESATGDIKANAVTGLVTAVARAAHAGLTINSLADLSRPCRVEPITIIDKSIAHQSYMEPVMKYALSQFAGYYLQAANMLLNIKNINTLKVFDTLNPERTFGGLMDVAFSGEHYKAGLPELHRLEHSDYNRTVFHTISNESRNDKPEGVPSIAATVGNHDKVNEIPNLAVGKLLDIKINEPENSKNAGRTASLPVLIRLVPAPIDSDVISEIFTAGGKQTWGHRLFLAKTGQIRFWRDFVMGSDLIDGHLNALIKDKTGVYSEIYRRRRNNVAKATTTGKVSMGDASNIAIVSSETIKGAARSLYGRLDDMATRRTIFDNSMLLMLIVVDNYHQRLTIYHRGLDISSTYRLDEIEMKERGKGSDIEQLFKMFSKQMHSNI